MGNSNASSFSLIDRLIDTRQKANSIPSTPSFRNLQTYYGMNEEGTRFSTSKEEKKKIKAGRRCEVSGFQFLTRTLQLNPLIIKFPSRFPLK